MLPRMPMHSPRQKGFILWLVDKVKEDCKVVGGEESCLTKSAGSWFDCPIECEIEVDATQANSADSHRQSKPSGPVEKQLFIIEK